MHQMGAGGTDDWDDMGKARSEELLPLMKDAQKMKDWLSSNCEAAPASGDELETYRRVGMLDTFSMPLVPVSRPVGLQIIGQADQMFERAHHSIGNVRSSPRTSQQFCHLPSALVMQRN